MANFYNFASYKLQKIDIFCRRVVASAVCDYYVQTSE